MSRQSDEKNRPILVQRFGAGQDEDEQAEALDLPCSLCGREDVPVTLVFNGTQQAAICEQCLGEEGDA